MDNHLIIGIGGTGGKTIQELRKTIYRRHGSADPDAVNLSYLYVDSSKTDLDNQADWKVFGRSVELPETSKLPIVEADLPKRIEEVDKYHGLRGWVGDRQLWLPYLRNTHNTQAAGGQRRRLGRVLFASNAGKFNTAVGDLVNTLEGGRGGGRAGAVGVTFHIVCGLAGGTGSGSVLDAICQIRNRWPKKGYPILVYALLPEENPDAAWAISGYYHANGYAAVTELNALSAGRWHPHDVASDGKRLSLRDRFNGCYLITNRTESRTVYNVRDMPSVIADFLFQKIVAVRHLTNWDTLPRWENGENGDPSPESSGRKEDWSSTAVGEDSDDEGTGERSLRFMTFGIKRIVIPETEIREYLGYSFARAAALQLKSNNWTDEFGYIEGPRNADFAWVTHRDTQNRWHVSNEHLLLSIPILETDKNAKWRTIEEDWEFFLSNVAQDVANPPAVKKKLVLEDLDKRCHDRFESDFRKLGVPRFYQEKYSRRRNEAREVCSIVERELIERWLSGGLSVSEIAGGKLGDREIRGVVQELRDDVTRRKEKVDQSIVSLREVEKEMQATLSSNKKTWANMGALSEWMGKGKKLLQAQIDTSKTLYVSRTKIHAWNYAKALLGQVEEELSLLAGEATRVATTVNNAVAIFDKEISHRCRDKPHLDFSKQLVKFYDSANVAKITDRLTKDWETQKTQCAEVRSAVLGRINAQMPTFASFNRDIHEEALLEVFVGKCLELSKTAHDALELSDEERLLGLNIIERIKTRYRSPEELKGLAKEIVPKASCFGVIDEAQRAEADARSNPQSICQSSISILGPNLGDTNDKGEPNTDPFITSLKAAFRGARPSATIACAFVPTGAESKHEICLVSLTNLIPARCLEHTAFLRNEYEKVLRRTGDRSQDRLFLHLEGDGTQYPGIYTRERKEIEAEARSILLLGCGLGIVAERTNKISGVPAVYFDVERDGIVESRELGRSMFEIPARIEHAVFEEIEDKVKRELRALVHVDQKESVKDKMISEVQKIKAGCNDEPTHPDYKAFIAGYKKALELLGLR